jgi:predicted Zn-dependent protease
MKRILFLFLGLFISSCQINPITGDNNLKVITNEQAIQQAKVAYSYILSSNQINLDLNRIQYERIQKIYNSLLPFAKRVSSDANQWDWEIHLINSNTINAFCMPGGKIVIYSGLIDKLNPSDDALAHIIGHEMGHALAGHVVAQQSLKALTDIGLLAANSKYKNNPQAQNSLRDLSNVFISLPFSRVQESQADEIGLEIMTRAGYNPERSVEFFQKMIAMHGSHPIDFFNNHPSDNSRIEHLTKLIPEMRNINPNQLTLSLVDKDFQKFSNGLVELDCNAGCGFSNGQNRKQVIELYEKQAWKELAVVTVKINFIRDLNYFYLGRAAEALGFKEAAKIYYKKAIELSATTKRCDVLFSFQCNGIHVAKESEDGLNRLN